MERASVIQVESLGKRYRVGGHRSAQDREFWALQDVSFDVGAGEVVGIIGRNGSGKSTLLKILSRITPPTAGRAVIHGRVRSLLEVGTGFHPELTGRENVYLNGAIQGMRRAEIDRKFDEIVEFAGVARFIDTPVKHYSSGMYVRLAFAVAAHLEPEILLIDEVLAVGDADFQRRCLGKMGEVARSGRTVLFVSHNMSVIQSLCGRVIVLRDGRVRAIAPPREATTLYLDGDSKSRGGTVDVSNHAGRTGGSTPSITCAWMKNAAGQPCDVMQMGGSLRLGYRFHCARPIVSPTFAFVIETDLGIRVFTVNNRMSDIVGLDRSVYGGEANCELENVPLLPGRYHVHVALVEHGREVVDQVDRALTFHVEPADVFGNGVVPQPHHGLIYQPAKMSFQSEHGIQSMGHDETEYDALITGQQEAVCT